MEPGATGLYLAERAPWETELTLLDSRLNWVVASRGGVAEPTLPVVIITKAGVSPAQLLRPPQSFAAPPIDAKDWRANLVVDAAHLAPTASSLLERESVLTARVSTRFLEWVRDNPDVANMIAAVELSRGLRAATRAPTAPRGARIMEGPVPGGAAPPKPPVADVVLGVIDDWLAVPNSRFRRANGATRFLSLWHQGLSPAGSPAPGFGYGRHLDSAALDQLLALAGQDEERFDRLIHRPDRYRPQPRLTHGTHVADVFGGFDPARPAEAKMAARRPLVGVCLPPDAVADTSGLALSAYVIDALRYIADCVRPPGQPPAVIRPGTGDAPPVIVNLSYGWYSAAIDGTSVLERAITAFVEAYNIQHPHAPMVVTTSAGNSLQERGHARLPRAAGPPADAWRVKLALRPDDRTPSFVEFALPMGLDGFTITVKPPGLPPATVDKVTKFAQWNGPQGPLAQLLFELAGPGLPFARVTLCTAPTADPLLGGVPALAPHGIWEIALGGPDAVPGNEVHLWISRDVSLPGRPKRGQQAMFEDAEYRAFGPLGDVARADRPEAAIMRGGAINAIATGWACGPVSVGAAEVRGGAPSAYSGAAFPLPPVPGARPVRGPDCIAHADQSAVLGGMLASGTRSGSIVAMNGTSTAAPRAARALADRLAGNAVPPFAGDFGRALAAASVVPAAPPAPDPGRGWGLVSPQTGRDAGLIALRDR